SMSRAPFVLPKAETPFSRATEIHDTTIGWRFVNPRIEALHGTDSMPATAEIVAQERGVSREDQDAFALRSQERAARAIASGRLAREIVPVCVPQRRGEPVVVAQDEHPRATTLEAAAENVSAVASSGRVPRQSQSQEVRPTASCAEKRLVGRTSRPW